MWCVGRLLFKIKCFMYSTWLFSFAYINFNWNVLHPYTNSTLLYTSQQVTFTRFNISSHRKCFAMCVVYVFPLQFFFLIIIIIAHLHIHITYHDQRKEIFKHPLIFPCANQKSNFPSFFFGTSLKRISAHGPKIKGNERVMQCTHF